MYVVSLGKVLASCMAKSRGSDDAFLILSYMVDSMTNDGL